MSEKSIQIQGINRAVPQTDAMDGSCQEIINARFRKGCWRPIGSKLTHKSINLSAYSQVWLHDIENGINVGQPNWIGLKSAIEVTIESLYTRAVELGYIGTLAEYDFLFSNYVSQISDNDAAYQLQVDEGYTGTFDQWNQPFANTLYLINSTTGVATIIESVQGSSINVSFLKRTMLVTSDDGLLVYLFTSDKLYAKTASLPVPNVVLNATKTRISSVSDDPEDVYTLSHLVNGDVDTDRGSSTASGLLGDFYAALNNASNKNGKLYGSLMYITAYRMFDGSYIMPSIPKYIEAGNGGIIVRTNPNFGSSDDRKFILLFDVSQISAGINNASYPSSFNTVKDIIESICVFATSATQLLQIDESTITDDMLNSIPTNQANKYTPMKNKVTTVNSDFKDLAKSTGWYKIHEFNFEDIVGKPGWTTKEVDTKGFYQDYANRETLPTDQFTHHKLIGREAYVYNDRVHLANIKTLLGKPYVQWPTENKYTVFELPGTATVWVKTSLGQAVRQSAISIPLYDIEGSFFFHIPSIIGYNDARAYKFQIAVTIEGVTHELFNESLTKNPTMNFSFWHNLTFNANENFETGNFKVTAKLGSLVEETYPTVTIPEESGLPFDTNRMQVSEIQNPLVFPAKNSYQIGTGNILKLCSGSEPLSTGQFGQFPLQVFTSKGIWAMEIGTGDVLYTNVLPVNGEVADNPLNIIPVGSGVVYSTVKGLFLVNGRQVTEIADVLEGSLQSGISGSPHIATLITNDRFTPELINSISDCDFLEYLGNSSIGWDQLQKELIVTNPAKGYSYILSVESKTWYKISRSYRLLINAYPKLLGVTDTIVVSLSDESTTEDVSVLIISNCQALELPEVHKKISRAVLRSKITTPVGKSAGLYLFATNDATKYQFLTGSQRTGSFKDLTISRSHGSAKFYVACINGRMSPTSEIKNIDLIFETKWNNRLR